MLDLFGNHIVGFSHEVAQIINTFSNDLWHIHDQQMLFQPITGKKTKQTFFHHIGFNSLLHYRKNKCNITYLNQATHKMSLFEDVKLKCTALFVIFL